MMEDGDAEDTIGSKIGEEWPDKDGDDDDDGRGGGSDTGGADVEEMNHEDSTRSETLEVWWGSICWRHSAWTYHPGLTLVSADEDDDSVSWIHILVFLFIKACSQKIHVIMIDVLSDDMTCRE